MPMTAAERRELLRERARARGWKPLAGKTAPILPPALGRGYFSLVPFQVNPASIPAKWLAKPESKPAEKLRPKRRTGPQPLMEAAKKAPKKLARDKTALRRYAGLISP